MSTLASAGVFLINTLFASYSFILLLRLLLQYLRIDYYNPLSQFVVKATSPVIVPLRRVIPGYLGIDLATVVAIFIASWLKIILISIIGAHRFPNIAGMILWSVGDVINDALKLFFYAILGNVVLSWLAPHNSPMISILHQLTEPLMRPARRYIPPIAGFDISPIAVLIVLQLSMIIVSDPLLRSGQWLALH